MTEAVNENTKLQLGPTGSFVASPKEAMNFLGIARAKLYELIASGEVESYREGGGP
jgi:hypothetical protein